jgi:hypothetical protein
MFKFICVVIVRAASPSLHRRPVELGCEDTSFGFSSKRNLYRRNLDRRFIVFLGKLPLSLLIPRLCHDVASQTGKVRLFRPANHTRELGANEDR